MAGCATTGVPGELYGGGQGRPGVRQRWERVPQHLRHASTHLRPGGRGGGQQERSDSPSSHTFVLDFGGFFV